MEAAPALVAMTMYFVAGGDGCDGVPGRGDIRVRELGTLMMLGVRGPVVPLSPLCETVRVGRGYKTESRQSLLNTTHRSALFSILYLKNKQRFHHLNVPA